MDYFLEHNSNDTLNKKIENKTLNDQHPYKNNLSNKWSPLN